MKYTFESFCSVFWEQYKAFHINNNREFSGSQYVNALWYLVYSVKLNIKTLLLRHWHIVRVTDAQRALKWPLGISILHEPRQMRGCFRREKNGHFGLIFVSQSDCNNGNNYFIGGKFIFLILHWGNITTECVPSRALLVCACERWWQVLLSSTEQGRACLIHFHFLT